MFWAFNKAEKKWKFWILKYFEKMKNLRIPSTMHDTASHQPRHCSSPLKLDTYTPVSTSHFIFQGYVYE